MSFSVESIAEFAKLQRENKASKPGEILSMLLTVTKLRKAGEDEITVDYDNEQSSEGEQLVKKYSLDGLYVEFQSDFLTNKTLLSNFCARNKGNVGIWGRAKLDPDNVATVTKLVECGVRFVNTDFPENFSASL